MESLSHVGRAKQKVFVLKNLANWWLDRFGNEQESVAWGSDAETLRQELNSIRGVSLEMTDRLLLFVGDLPVYPVSRASMRIACRHGWMGIESEYEEWQSFFVQGAGLDPAALRAFALWTICVGKEHCGPTPKCDACPLEPLLPDGGPYEPEG